MTVWLKDLEEERSAELGNLDWDLRQELEASLTAYSKKVTALLGDAEDFDEQAMRDRIDNMFDWARMDLKVSAA